MKRIVSILLFCSFLFSLAGCGAKAEAPAPAEAATTVAPTPEPVPESAPEPTPKPYSVFEPAADQAIEGLLDAMEQERNTLWVYKDYSSALNRFTQKCAMGSNGSFQKEMNENWQDDPFEGSSCIRCEQHTEPSHWGGWMFLNGYMPDGSNTPQLNTGRDDKQGIDLCGADCLRFYAKGEQGGEIVEFFTAGFGYDGATNARTAAYPDSCTKKSLGYVKLSDTWEEYEIDLSYADLSYIVCGFGYVFSGDMSRSGDNVFYLDAIRFEGEGVNKARLFLPSYQTDNHYLVNTAYTYDNALAAMAFLSESREEEAEELLDAFVYAVNHDRYKIGRIRNAYSIGGISSDPGWGESVRLPGWYDQEQAMWCEDRYQVGCNTGITAYAALALLHGYESIGDQAYLDTAAVIMDWVIETCSDANPGFTAGYDGWPEGSSSDVYPFSYKSIEHNIDAYAAFRELYACTGESCYAAAAQSALAFIRSMYNAEEGYFYTGTGDDGVTPDTSNPVLDAQVWCAMALGEEFAPYENALLLMDRMRTEENAYPFCYANENGGWWSEGSAFTALLLRELGRDTEAAATLDTLCAVQLENGLFPAASNEHLSTGIRLFTGEPWEYGTNAHIAPAAWFIMAVNAYDPYSFS